jgi:Phosphoglucose isomerase
MLLAAYSFLTVRYFLFYFLIIKYILQYADTWPPAHLCRSGANESSERWLCTVQNSANESKGRTLRFLANVDPVDVARALNSLDPATTMAVVVSKTFTTAETMLNARTVR